MDSDLDISNSFERCLQLIILGSSNEVKDAWSRLQLMEFDGKYSDLNFPLIFRSLLQVPVKNLLEIPQLLVWFSKYLVLKNEDQRTKPYSDSIAFFLKCSNVKDIEVLKELTFVIQQNDIYIPQHLNHSLLCKAIVETLAELNVPEKEGNKEFINSVKKVLDFLKKLCQIKNTKNYDRSNDIVCLEKLYFIALDTSTQQMPHYALSVVLQLVDIKQIPLNVQRFLEQPRPDSQLERAMKVLCEWLCVWPQADHLTVWVMEFIKGLEKSQKYLILNNVANTFLDRMCRTSCVPLYRQNMSQIVPYMLKRQGIDMFQAINKSLKLLLEVLRKNDSENDKDFIQNLVDVITALQIKFSLHSSKSLMHYFPRAICPRNYEVNKILEGPFWIKDEIESIATTPYQPIVGKVGLINLGNTCYMNSVLQALAMTKQFCYDVLNYKSPTDLEDQVLLRKLQNLFALLMYSKRPSLAPKDILHASRPVYFMPGHQQDSSEFLCYLLDQLYEQERSIGTSCANAEPSEDLKSKIDDEEMRDDVSNIKRWTTEENLTENAALQRKTQSLADFTQGEYLDQTQHLSDSHSDSTDSGIQSVGGDDANAQSILVHRVFGGETKVTYRCSQCQTSSHNTDKFRDLQLCFPDEIQANEKVSVQKLIEHYLETEQLTGENQYYCEKCKALCDAQRSINILQAPAHLILTLKQFRYDSESCLRTKLQHKVAYSESINLPVNVNNCIVTETYKLYAAVVHSGSSMDYGHYFTYACDYKQNWYMFNDCFVSPTRLENIKVLEPPDTPYILFYTKCSTIDISEEEKPEVAALNTRLQDLLQKDRIKYEEELKQGARSMSSNQSFKWNQNRRNDDDNPPPSNCRENVTVLM